MKNQIANLHVQNQVAEIEWKLLHTPLLILLVSLALAITLLTSAWFYNTQMQTLQSQASNNLTEIEDKHKSSQEALAVYQSFADKFKQLQTHYFLQPEERSNQWLERIEGLKNWKEFLTILDASSEGTENYNLSGVQMEKDFIIKIWKLRLKMQLLHTRNLIEFIDYLYSTYPDGLYNFKECELVLKREFEYDWRENISADNLEASCVLQWYAAEIRPDTPSN